MVLHTMTNEHNFKYGSDHQSELRNVKHKFHGWGEGGRENGDKTMKAIGMKSC